MINLLPPDIKKARRYARINTELVNYMLYVFVFGLVGVGILLFNLKISNDNRSQLTYQLSEKSKTAEQQKTIEHQKQQLQQISDVVTQIDTISQPIYGASLDAIAPLTITQRLNNILTPGLTKLTTVSTYDARPRDTTILIRDPSVGVALANDIPKASLCTKTAPYREFTYTSFLDLAAQKKVDTPAEKGNLMNANCQANKLQYYLPSPYSQAESDRDKLEKDFNARFETYQKSVETAMKQNAFDATTAEKLTDLATKLKELKSTVTAAEKLVNETKNDRQRYPTSLSALFTARTQYFEACNDFSVLVAGSINAGANLTKDIVTSQDAINKKFDDMVSANMNFLKYLSGSGDLYNKQREFMSQVESFKQNLSYYNLSNAVAITENKVSAPQGNVLSTAKGIPSSSQEIYGEIITVRNIHEFMYYTNPDNVQMSTLLKKIQTLIPNGSILTGLSITADKTKPLSLDFQITEQRKAGIIQQNLATSDIFNAADILNIVSKGASSTTTTAYPYTTTIVVGFKNSKPAAAATTSTGSTPTQGASQ